MQKISIQVKIPEELRLEARAKGVCMSKIARDAIEKAVKEANTEVGPRQ